MEDIYKFVENLPIPQSDCAAKCEIASFCYAFKYVDDFQRSEGIIPSSAAAEADSIIADAIAEMQAPLVAENYQRWRDKMRDHYVDSPEKLQEVLESIDHHEDENNRLRQQNHATRQETIKQTAALEEELAEDRKTYGEFIALRDERDCSGPVELVVGRFLARRTIMICQLQDEPKYEDALKARQRRDSRIFKERFRRRIEGS